VTVELLKVYSSEAKTAYCTFITVQRGYKFQKAEHFPDTEEDGYTNTKEY
jgi:hypothetical protein